MGRTGEIDEILYLERADFVTGETINVDGGRHAGFGNAKADRNDLSPYPRRTTMPYVNIKVTREGTAPGATSTTPEQKAALIKGVSDLLFDILGKPQSSTFVVIDEVEMENWGVGGLMVQEYRKQIAGTAKPSK